jgi:hypothetical protein
LDRPKNLYRFDGTSDRRGSEWRGYNGKFEQINPEVSGAIPVIYGIDIGFDRFDLKLKCEMTAFNLASRPALGPNPGQGQRNDAGTQFCPRFPCLTFNLPFYRIVKFSTRSLPRRPFPSVGWGVKVREYPAIPRTDDPLWQEYLGLDLVFLFHVLLVILSLSDLYCL